MHEHKSVELVVVVLTRVVMMWPVSVVEEVAVVLALVLSLAHEQKLR